VSTAILNDKYLGKFTDMFEKILGYVSEAQGDMFDEQSGVRKLPEIIVSSVSR
jgi:hypothetical protein